MTVPFVYSNDFKLVYCGEVWLGGRDSNPDSQIQSLESYHWTTSQQRNLNLRIGVHLVNKAGKGEEGKEGHGDAATWGSNMAPGVSASPCLRVSASPRPRFPFSLSSRFFLLI